MSEPNHREFKITSQLWCIPKHSQKEMDVEFAMSIAQALHTYGNQREAEAVEKFNKILDSVLATYTYDNDDEDAIHLIAIIRHDLRTLLKEKSR